MESLDPQIIVHIIEVAAEVSSGWTMTALWWTSFQLL